jgi:predicted alpha/beta-hydrolase family hydrolase
MADDRDQLEDSVLELDTPHGLARVHIHHRTERRGSIVLGHGAGGGIEAPDLRAAVEAATRAGLVAVLVEQPYRVAGRRAQAPAGQLDGAWISVVEQLRAAELVPGPLVVGGRSAGARVACRTAGALAAQAVLCLAFPAHPPGKAEDPLKSRLPELEAVTVPVLVVQGERDPFGRPPPGPNRRVVLVPGTHALRGTGAVEQAVAQWLAECLPR